MTLQAQVRHFPAYAPLDESTRAELLEPGQALLAGENVRPTEVGGLETRRGFTFQTLSRLDATTRSAGYKQFAHGPQGKQTCVVDGPTLDAYSPATAVNISRGRLPECVLSMMDAQAGGLTGSLTITGAAKCGNYVCYAYSAAGSSSWEVYTVILDATTGAVVRGPETKFSASAECFCLIASWGTNFLQVFIELTSANIKTSLIDMTSAATITTGWGSAQTPITDRRASGVAVSVESMSNYAAILYANNSAGALRLTLAATTGGASPTMTVSTSTASVDPDAVAVQSNQTDRIWVAWNQGTTCKVRGFKVDDYTTVLSGTGSIIVSAATPSDLGITSSSTAGAGRLYVYEADRIEMRDFVTSAGTAVTSGSTIPIYAVIGGSRPFTLGTRNYTLCQPYKATGSQQKIATLCDVSDANAWIRPVAHIAPGNVSAPLTQCPWIAVSATEYWCPVGIQSNGSVIGISFAKLDFASSQRFHTVSQGDTTCIGGACVAMFDGVRVSEAAFLHAPPKPGVANGAAGTLNGSYKYVAVYEHVDAAGNWHVSSVSEPSATATPANQKVTVTVYPLAMSARIAFTTDPAVRVSIYRTGGTAGAAPYYYVATKANSLGALSFTFTDDTATITSNAKLYAPSLPGVNGGSQDHRAPPGLTYLETGNDVTLGAQGDVVHGSSQSVVGSGLWWNPIWQQPVSGGGDITGIKFQDGTFYVFKRRAIFAIPVAPPSDNAMQGGIGTPRKLAVDVGCIDARSLVVTSLGIFFQSERGLELLTRAQSVEYVGQNVEKTLASYPVCTSATLDPIRNVIYFELAASESAGVVSGNGRTLVFDLVQKAFVSTDRRPKYDGTADTPAQSGCMIWDGSTYRYAWLQTDGRVRPEQSAYYDTGSSNSFIVPLAEYPALKLGLQQQAAMWGGTVLLENYSAAGLKIEHAYDWAAYSSSDDKVWTESETSGKRQLEWRPKIRAGSMRLRVSATAPVTLGTGRGFTFVGFSFDLAPKQGSTKGTPHLDVTTRK